jgi:hypothetical protein
MVKTSDLICGTRSDACLNAPLVMQVLDLGAYSASLKCATDVPTFTPHHGLPCKGAALFFLSTTAHRMAIPRAPTQCGPWFRGTFAKPSNWCYFTDHLKLCMEKKIFLCNWICGAICQHIVGDWHAVLRQRGECRRRRLDDNDVDAWRVGFVIGSRLKCGAEGIQGAAQGALTLAFRPSWRHAQCG